MSKNIATVVSKIVAELEGLKSDEERERAFAGARAVLGMAGTANASPSGGGRSDLLAPAQDGANLGGISPAGASWIKRSGLTSEMIEAHFDVDEGKVTLIADAIGKGKREQSMNTYLLTGIAALLETGKPEFTDKAAREYCTQFGCYDSANHAGMLAQLGNKVTGSKKSGWKLTSPGLNAAAALLKPTPKEK